MRSCLCSLLALSVLLPQLRQYAPLLDGNIQSRLVEFPLQPARNRDGCFARDKTI